MGSTKRLKLLDLFCGAGGAAMGYHLAGFDVTGVDIKPQPHYPFAFYQAEALTFLEEYGWDYDVIHASPPCQRYSVLTPTAYKQQHPDLIGVLRNILQKLRAVYVIENVAGAVTKMNSPVMLCGSMFGLNVWRHRYFELSFTIGLVWSCNHSNIPVLVSGTSRRQGVPRRDACLTEKKTAMRIDWMTTRELDQAIPPAYTEFIGKQLLSARTI